MGRISMIQEEVIRIPITCKAFQLTRAQGDARPRGCFDHQPPERDSPVFNRLDLFKRRRIRASASMNQGPGTDDLMLL